jgi:anhydro-N-acetylmuramic acid kinase
MADLVIGLMSGTSLDGVDAVLAHGTGPTFAVRGHVWRAFEPALRAELLALNRSGADELHRAALAGNAVARAYADAVVHLLQTQQLKAENILALGAHGQTVRHRPGEFDGSGYTVQLLNGALLAELTGIDVVCDFRSRDLAAGGQGAPLVPAFHAAVFARPGQSHAVLNLGGMANLTLLAADGCVSGFDCGPGNVLMDHWCRQHLGQDFDVDGTWAAGGTVCQPLLAGMLAEPFFHRAPPKSTGRDLFDADWLAAHVAATPTALSPRDVQATLAELTVRSATDALRRHLPTARTLLVCGGGALNGWLMARLAQGLPGLTVQASDAAGLPPMQVEAAAFAWLAQAMRARRPGNLPEVTGARGLRVLGALYPAS